MQIVRDNIWLCQDCTIAAVNGDYTGFDDQADIDDTNAGLDRLGVHLVADFDGESGDGIESFSWGGCHCCNRNANKGGDRHRFAVLGP